MKPGTVIAWVARGFITRYPEGYSTRELIERVDSRDTGKAVGAVLATASRSNKCARNDRMGGT